MTYEQLLRKMRMLVLEYADDNDDNSLGQLDPPRVIRIIEHIASELGYTCGTAVYSDSFQISFHKKKER